LYVHLPWCVRKCPYCDFNSHTLREELPADRYITSLLDDLDQDLQRVAGRQVQTIYFGGGTPSLFQAAHIGRLLAGFDQRLAIAADAEVTLEANPGTIEHDSFAAYRAAGVNRVSLGVQSFDDGCLQKIGRIHGSGDVRRAIESLHQAGLDNFNIDLMFALPGQTPRMAASDVQQAIAAQPAHVSHYQLTLEPNTAFAANPPPLPHEDASWDMQEQCASLLQAAGFEQYEISAWSRLGRASAHNLNYWAFGDYLGIGAGAHAKLTDTMTGRVTRLAKHRHPQRYMGGSYIADERELAVADLVFEFFLNGLRLRCGISRDEFCRRTGQAWEVAQERVDAALALGLLESTDTGFRPSELGWRFSNDLQALFLS
jgi:oxygen-independent coproporphyrinogen-3 oxidase